MSNDPFTFVHVCSRRNYQSSHEYSRLFTRPFRGVNGVNDVNPEKVTEATAKPEKSSTVACDLFGMEPATESTNCRAEFAGLVEAPTAQPGKENQHD